jgi:hypothetical protein
MLIKPKITDWLAVLAVSLAVSCADDSSTGPQTGDNGNGTADGNPPERVVDLELSYPSVGGAVVFTWTAPGDDEQGDVARYDVRYSHSFPFSWEISLAASDPPVPGSAGEQERYEFTAPPRGRDLYAAVRSYDTNGNASLVSNVAHVYVVGYNLSGQCFDMVTGDPLVGLEVDVTGRYLHSLNSDEQGGYVVGDVATGMVNVAVRSGESAKVFHDYDYAFELTGNTSLEHPMVEYEPTEIQAGGNIFSLFLEAAGFTTFDPTFIKWRSYPIPVFVPSFVNTHGVDYGDLCRRAVQHWNERTERSVFVLVDSPPGVGVTMAFKTRAEMGIQVGITRHENDAEGYPLTSNVDIVDELVDPDRLWTIALHELGHTIRLHHLPAGYLMYASHPLPDSVTNDEAKVVRLYLAIPNGSDLSVYDASDPR